MTVVLLTGKAQSRKDVETVRLLLMVLGGLSAVPLWVVSNIFVMQEEMLFCGCCRSNLFR